ncbi:hypothetical protein [Nocardiopsis composta]|uniref:Uncharacterized protein n=1 Tax=Nocardiopsis composta TaxID=157465 RepID=A0A7W8QL16_9ACTN|nr:hypothetical protein [Nocardiopsis composta]MBB5431436.1 hypothetical protein [Nocardiopsis composta]
MSILQPGMKRIRLDVPDVPEFSAVRDLDGSFAEVADPRDRYRFKRGDRTVVFEATGESFTEEGTEVAVFSAVRVAM